MSLQFYNQSKVLLYIKQLEQNEPVFIEIHPSMLCNHKCVWCRYGHSKDQLSIEQMEDIIEKYPNVKGVRISGGGEPLVNSNTVDFLEYCHSKGITVGIETNGELLTDKSIDVIARCCQYCRISLDAANADTYELLHGSKGYIKVLDSISKLRQAGVKELGISYLVVKENVKEMLDVIDLNLPLDYVHFKPIIQGLDERTRTLALLMATQWESTYSKVKVRFDRLQSDDVNDPQLPCRITKLIRVLGGDGIEYVCCEKAYQDKYAADKWNGSTRECLSCRYNGYNEILNQYYKNKMVKELL